MFTDRILFRVIVAALAVLVLLLAVQAAVAQGGNCGHFGALSERLASKYDEQPVGRGLGANGTLVTIFAGSAAGSWSIVVTQPDYSACLVASGQSWVTYEPQPRGEDG